MFKQIQLTFLCVTLLLTTACQNPLIKSSDSTSTADEIDKLKQEAALYYNANNYEAALPLFQELSTKLPADELIRLRTGNILARLNRPVEAIQYYQEALNINPKLATAWHNMGVIQLRQTSNTFEQMVHHISPNDPLHPRAVALSDALSAILGKRQTTPTKSK